MHSNDLVMLHRSVLACLSFLTTRNNNNKNKTLINKKTDNPIISRSSSSPLFLPYPQFLPNPSTILSFLPSSTSASASQFLLCCDVSSNYSPSSYSIKSLPLIVACTFNLPFIHPSIDASKLCHCEPRKAIVAAFWKASEAAGSIFFDVAFADCVNANKGSQVAFCLLCCALYSSLAEQNF